ncbi:cupin domain-containing protein [Treponema pedis]|uniref:cupin domain-containing protein n=1 Tax=Treponema pedis TaxID=409322 RepID=UPI00126859C5|nr:cupin domain-containing protein [Treponema pedis]
MKSGEGDILFSNYVSKADIPNCRLLSEMTIPCNGSIGEHQHIDETEIYIIKSGIATINDNSVKKVVGAGDVIITYNGEFHSIKILEQNR